jgi:hypothetical protein
MKFGIKSIFAVICFSCIATVFAGCKIFQSPISMVKKTAVWINDYGVPITYNQVLNRYPYFDSKTFKWADEKLNEQWYIKGVILISRFNLEDKYMGDFIFGPGETTPGNVLKYFKQSLGIDERRKLNDEISNYIYTEGDRERMESVAAEMDAGNIKEISFSNNYAYLRWITHKLSGINDSGHVFFVGTYIISDVKFKKNDASESVHNGLAFFTTLAEPINPYLEGDPFFGPVGRDRLEEFLLEELLRNP